MIPSAQLRMKIRKSCNIAEMKSTDEYKGKNQQQITDREGKPQWTKKQNLQKCSYLK